MSAAAANFGNDGSSAALMPWVERRGTWAPSRGDDGFYSLVAAALVAAVASSSEEEASIATAVRGSW